MNEATDLRIVLFREGDFWLAQGVDHDFGVQADNLKDLMSRLGFLLAAEMADGGLTRLQPSPKYFQDLWAYRAGAFTPQEAYLALMPPAVRPVFAMVA